MGETIRVEHSKDYTVISNVAIRDTRLSFKSRGLHHLLLSYPNGWQINTEHLSEQSDKDGKDAIASALKELESVGYLIRTQIRVKGKIVGYESTIRELPLENPPQPKGRRSKKKPKLGNPDTAKPDRENPEPGKPDTAKPDRENPELENPVHINYLFNEVIDQEISREEVSIPPNPQNENSEKGNKKPQSVEVEVLKAESALEQTRFPGNQNPGFSVGSEDPSLGQSSPPLALIETTADRVRRVYQETGNLPRIPAELEAWVQIDLGSEIVASYRKSGRITTFKQGDIQPDFARYVSAQNKGKDIDYGYSYIRNLEKDPTRWETLAALVIKWQASNGNDTLNITREISKQNQFDYSWLLDAKI